MAFWSIHSQSWLLTKISIKLNEINVIKYEQILIKIQILRSVNEGRKERNKKLNFSYHISMINDDPIKN